MERKSEPERVPWYRDRKYKGNLTEAEKRKLDSFRSMEPHPAPSYETLRPEVQNYINRLEMEIYDNKQEKIAAGALLISLFGGISIYLMFRGYHTASLWKYFVSALLLLVPWFVYRYQWSKNAREYLPDDMPTFPTDEALRQEWELEYVASDLRPPKDGT